MSVQILKMIEGQSLKFGEWLKGKEDQLKAGFSFKDFYLAFSMASRINGSDKAISGDVVVPWGDMLTMEKWPLSRLGRVYLIIALGRYSRENLKQVYQQLFETATLTELTALYSALSFLPEPEHYADRAAEGIRTNMGDVFDAVALGNPYPAKYLPEAAWNQMVLKAVFTNKPLYKIVGIDDRANEPLALMLINYAQERWAAGRPVTPELWRPVGKFLQSEHLPLIENILKGKGTIEHEAAILACTDSASDAVKTKVGNHPDVKEKIEEGQLTWNSLGEKYWANNEA